MGEKKPVLVLLPIEGLKEEELVDLYFKLTGRQPTPEELEELRKDPLLGSSSTSS